MSPTNRNRHFPKTTIAFYKMHRRNKRLLHIILLILGLFHLGSQTIAQSSENMVRMAKLKIDQLQLEAYQQALMEQMTQAI
jgi:hypothetical protein